MGNYNCSKFCHSCQNETNLNNGTNNIDNTNDNSQKKMFLYNNKENLNQNDLDDEIKNKFEENLPKIGSYIPLNEFNDLVGKEVRTYIKNYKLSYEKYMPKDLRIFPFKPIKLKDNNIYKGYWNKDMEIEGYGIFINNDTKIITEGIWVKGNLVFGRIFFPNKDIYEGEINNSIPEGKGKFFFSNNDIYEGDFKNGEMNGKGYFLFEDNTKYEGNIENGLFKGMGNMKWNNGIEYIGNFLDSSLCGEGIITNRNNKEKYKGNFDKNEFNGKGIYYYENGDEYEGNFEYGIKKGKGLFKTKNGLIYDGDWNNDMPNGNGEITYQGKKIKGYWRNGIFIGNNDLIENKEDINKDIKPNKFGILTCNLTHLDTFYRITSQYTAEN